MNGEQPTEGLMLVRGAGGGFVGRSSRVHITCRATDPDRGPTALTTCSGGARFLP